MASIQKWNCSWSLGASIASIIALVTMVHLFFFPLVPSLDNLTQFRNSALFANSSTGAFNNRVKEDPGSFIDWNRKFPPDSHNAVSYLGAPWKSHIGQWLSGCDAITKELQIVELIGGSGCKNDCSGQGVCNHEFGQCQCFHGFSGEGCSEKRKLECNHPGSEELPYGKWVVSICPAHCDTTRAMCFCGEGTKYPNRPVAESCGFQMKTSSETHAPKVMDLGKADLDNIYTMNGTQPGWCNVDPAEAYASKVRFKEECDCKYDCLLGRFCEIPVSCICINQCSGHGYCRGGFCQCHKGWYGVDCSIPSVEVSVREWPQWLLPARIDVPDRVHVTEKVFNLNPSVNKRRPLIYVYDLPPMFNGHLLEGRHWKFECVNRIYDHRNATMWTEDLYGAQMAFYESILASPYRTLNGEEADFFFVPVLDSCIITRADDAPHLSLKDLMTKRIIGKGHESGGLYVLDPDKPIACSGVSSAFDTHYRFGHPSLFVFKQLCPQFKHLSSLDCESCQFAKHHRVSLGPQVNKRACAPFELVHSDVWGPCPVLSKTRFRYFVIFIDDYSRMT